MKENLTAPVPSHALHDLLKSCQSCDSINNNISHKKDSNLAKVNSGFKRYFLFPFGLGFSLLFSSAPSFANTPYNDCDNLAADNTDTSLPSHIKGVEWEDINADEAIAACEIAVNENPNNPRFLTQLGRAYESKEDYEKALELYTQAAESNHAIAYSYLGWLYEQGFGVEQSYEKAVEMYHLAADHGDVDAMNTLGWFYDKGEALPQSYENAMVWYRKAALMGYPMAQNNVGMLYDNGHGVTESDSEAFKWYNKAAKNGYPAGQFNLASMYETGEGVEKSAEQALYWYEKAAAQGDPYAIEAVIRLEGSLEF